MPKPPLNGHRAHVILTEPQHKRLNALAAKTGLTVSELLRRAVDLFIQNQNQSKAK